jgi:glc operon protein GlcG
MNLFFKFLIATAATCVTCVAFAQVPQYGNSITLEQAKKALVAAEAEAIKNKWPVAIAIVDNAGQLVAYARMDNTQTASVQVSIDKAVSAATYRRATKVFQDAVAGGGVGVRVLGLRGAIPIDGGLVIMQDGKIIGGIGVSGVNSDQDAVVAKAGVDTVK